MTPTPPAAQRLIDLTTLTPWVHNPSLDQWESTSPDNALQVSAYPIGNLWRWAVFDLEGAILTTACCPTMNTAQAAGSLALQRMLMEKAGAPAVATNALAAVVIELAGFWIHPSQLPELLEMLKPTEDAHPWYAALVQVQTELEDWEKAR